jgi:hypothetical protein
MPYELRVSEKTARQIDEFRETFPLGVRTLVLDRIYMELMKLAADPRIASHARDRSLTLPEHRFVVEGGGESREVRVVFRYLQTRDEGSLDLLISAPSKILER